jgi:hypothetical protein
LSVTISCESRPSPNSIFILGSLHIFLIMFIKCLG